MWRVGLRPLCVNAHSHWRIDLSLARSRLYTSGSGNGYEARTQLNASHSQFLAEASARGKWDGNGHSFAQEEKDDLEGVTATAGKISPTSSHLFKLILPLDSILSDSKTKTNPPTVFLLHPSQPLSHVARLITSSLARLKSTPIISFRSTSASGKGKIYQWSDSTDIGDFIKDAARSAQFSICFQFPSSPAERARLPAADQREEQIVSENEQGEQGVEEKTLIIKVPTFADRTRYMRRRLVMIDRQLADMEGLKKECDKEAHRGVKRMAMGGFGMLVVYWGTVARLTFWDYGWDFMEPVTYLSGLSTVILGYLWFLYQGREVSYTSVLARSISARREALYTTRGFDIEQWIELVGERKALKAEIGRIAKDYEDDGKSKPDEKDKEDEKEKDDIPMDEKMRVRKVVEEETMKAIKHGDH